jgi:hypothetical protein
MIGSARDDRQFRRGVVLGLTMAEVLLLLIFLLMLLAAAKLKAEAASHSELAQKLSEKESELAVLQPLIQASGGNKSFDITKDYKRVVEQLAASDREKQDLKIKLSEMKEQTNRSAAREGELAALEAKLREMGVDPTDAATPSKALQKLADQAQAGKAAVEAGRDFAKVGASDQETVEALVKAARIAKEMADNHDDPNKLLQELGSCRADLKSCTNQTTYLNKKLNDKIGGFGLPPCWADERGNIQYIFNISLYDEGIEVEDAKVPGREQDQAKLPLSKVRYDQKLDKNAFSASFAELLNWSKQHECRFYVRLYDEMRSGDRSQYKSLRASVENNFYILISL